VLEEGATACCYAESEKSWISDPQGIAWETFLTTGESTVYGPDTVRPATAIKAACCAPITGRAGATGCCQSECGQ
jgi:hypothetical protein